jgi:hypothetical protein
MVGDEMWDLGFDRGLGLFGGFWLRGSVSLDFGWDLGFDRGLGLFGGFWLRGSVSLDFGWDFGRWLCWDFWWF